jgi:hypothetical protein
MDVQAGAVAATNAIFARSRGQKLIPKIVDGVTARQWFKKCWPVHQLLLGEIRPEWIVTLGWTTFELLKTEGKEIVEGLSHWDGWNSHATFKATFPLGNGESFRVNVLGVYHPTPGPKGPKGPARVGDGLRDFIERNLRDRID